MWDLSSLTRDQTHTPVVEARSLNHWTTREVPVMVISCKMKTTILESFNKTIPFQKTDISYVSPIDNGPVIHYQYSKHGLLKIAWEKQRLSSFLFLKGRGRQETSRLSTNYLLVSFPLPNSVHSCYKSNWEMKTYAHTKTYTRMFIAIAALFIIAKRWKQHKCLSPDKWINKMCISIQWNIIPQ